MVVDKFVQKQSDFALMSTASIAEDKTIHLTSDSIGEAGLALLLNNYVSIGKQFTTKFTYTISSCDADNKGGEG